MTTYMIKQVINKMIKYGNLDKVEAEKIIK